ncbi:MAG TPA: adenylate/guanylate cyclase domain-containing protein [Candidatus Acidoferrum sp.]|nr:adenylate/guanylate cyclase domain-containing protein [Candidatus Acidoferrum sp.]
MPDEKDDPQLLERKLATILSADVAEFSRLMGEDEEATLRTFRGHKQVFESLVAMHRGRVFNTAGDAILAEFVSAVEAVRCATDIQAALRTLNDKLPPNRQVRFRIGINLGDVMVQGQDLMGDGVNVAARLQTAAEPGGICISGSVHDQIRNKLSLSFLSLGEKNFKNIQQPVRTFSISEVEGGGTLPAAKPESSGAKGGALKWIAAAIVVLLAGGGYWAYTANQRSKTEQAQSAAAVTQPQPTTPPLSSTVPSTAPPPSTATPTAAASAAPPSLPATSQPGANPPASTAGVPANPAPHPRTPHSSADARTTPMLVGQAIDGAYGGPVCFAETKKEPHRCFRAEGTIAGGKITGQWFMGPEKKMIMVLNGDVSETGNVVIEMVMHKETPDGERIASISLQGTLKNGRIDTSGTFRNGRPATLNWRRGDSVRKNDLNSKN